MIKQNAMINVRDKVVTTRRIKAGLDEQGPVICEEGARGVVTSIEKSEPDGIEVRLASGHMWWFKLNQLKKSETSK
jgi:hypothetical protein